MRLAVRRWSQIPRGPHLTVVTNWRVTAAVLPDPPYETVKVRLPAAMPVSLMVAAPLTRVAVLVLAP